MRDFEGNEIPYRGKLAKRRIPTTDDLLKIPSNYQLTIDAYLGRNYAIDHGCFSIVFDNIIPVYTVSKGKIDREEGITLTSNILKVSR